MKINVVLADCKIDELSDFSKGLEKTTGEKFVIRSKVCNQGYSKWNNIRRYAIYATYPLKYVFHRSKYYYIVGWQQFFSIFFAFYSRLFHLKKKNILVAVNFTYKEKAGLAGKIYKKFMHYSINNKYLDYIHVLSNNYADWCAKEFGISKARFIVTPFGLPDTSEQWKDSKVDVSNYTLAIGRSNRDYDFLVEVWKRLPETENLVIICDTYVSKETLPGNILLKNDVTGEAQFPYIANSKMMVIPIEDGSICAGDTVLLKAMSYGKPVVVTVPSTLGEMYIEDGINGVKIPKDKDQFADRIGALLKNKEKCAEMSYQAKCSYRKKYSRETMGASIGALIKGRI